MSEAKRSAKRAFMCDSTSAERQAVFWRVAWCVRRTPPRHREQEDTTVFDEVEELMDSRDGHMHVCDSVIGTMRKGHDHDAHHGFTTEYCSPFYSTVIAMKMSSPRMFSYMWNPYLFL